MSKRNMSPRRRVGKLEYPIDKENQYNTKIKFTAIEVKPPSITAVRQFSDLQAGPDFITGPQKNPGQKTGIQVNNLQFEDIPGEIADLYVPLGGFQVNDGFDYAQSSLGLVGAGIAAAANRGETIAGSLMKGVSEAGQSFLDLFDVVAGDQAIGRIAQLRASQMIPGTAGTALTITARATMNPNIRTNFNGVSVREFNFQFQFLPCSQEESLAVKSIVQFFRFHAYPDELVGDRNIGEFSVGLDYPNMFKIQLLSKSGDDRFKNIGTPIKLSYLKAISTTYNPTSPVLHPDGSPTEVMMNLTFVEYKAQTRKDIEIEETDDFYNLEAQKQGIKRDTRASG